MKRLSDYKDDAAFDLLADLLEPISVIFADKELKSVWNKPKIEVAKYILKNHKKSATDILKAIDNSIEITPISVLKGVIELITDIEKDPTIKDFFKSAEQENGAAVTSGSAMVNTEENEQ